MLLTYPDIGKVLPCFPSFDADLYRAGNMIGMMTWLFSSMRDIMYSLFQKYNARSATCNKWILIPIFSTEKTDEKSRIYWPESAGWRHTWQFVWKAVLEFWQTGRARSHPESPQSRPKTSPYGNPCCENIQSRRQRKITSFWEHVLGQNFKSPLITFKR